MLSLFIRLMGGLLFLSVGVYSYLDRHNSCTALSIRLPKIVKALEAIREENAALEYQVACFEDPDRLLRIVGRPEYGHLQFPLTREVITLKEGLAMQPSNWTEREEEESSSRTALVIGATSSVR